MLHIQTILGFLDFVPGLIANIYAICITSTVHGHSSSDIDIVLIGNPSLSNLISDNFVPAII